MSPEVHKRKCEQMLTYLTRLRRHEHIECADYSDHIYEIERLLILLLEVAADMTEHELARRHQPVPETYKGVFRAAVTAGALPEELGAALEHAAGQRNILVHMYEQIDDELVRTAIPVAVRTYACFLTHATEWLNIS